jgi:DNA-binding beta-propeller fold protein YncE
VPFVAAAPPAPLRVTAPVAAVAIDAARRRVFALGARSLAVIDADKGTLLATIRIGGARSMAIEPLGGHVFVGTSDGHVSEIDPDRKSIVRTTDAGVPVDVLVYDAVTGRLYLDGGSVPAITVIDARTFKRTSSVAFPSGIPGAIAADPVTRDFYVAERGPSISVVDPQRGVIRATYPTPGLPGNSIVRFDDVFGQIVVVGSNGMLDIYDRAGTQRARISVPEGIVACDLDTGSHVLDCTGPPGVTFIQLQRDAAPQLAGSVTVGGSPLSSSDAKTRDTVVLHSNPDGSGMDFERFHAVDGR